MKPWQCLMALLMLLAVGCVPTRFSWSPDGRWMTVLGSDDTLRLADTDGKFLATTLPDIKLASWVPDSHHLLVVRDTQASKWAELEKYLTAPQVAAIIESAKRAREMALVYDWKSPKAKDWSDFGDQFSQQDKNAGRDTLKDQDLALPLILYIRDHPDDELRKKVPAQRWTELDKVIQTVHHIEMYDVDQADFPTHATWLVNTIHDVRELRPSPTGQAVLVVTKGDQEKSSDLQILPMDGSAPALTINSEAAFYPDWSSDGQYVIFVRAAGPAHGDDERLGFLSRIKVIDNDGNLITAPIPTEDLAGLVYSELSRVRCLKDGRIIFVSAEITLPATANEMPQRAELFGLMPSPQSKVIRLLPKTSYDQLGNSPQYLEISPDGTKASIPDQSGKVSVVDLTNGQVKIVQPKSISAPQGQLALMTVPQWRSDDELTFIAPDEKGHPSLVLWSLSKNSGSTLSRDWPAAIMESPAIDHK
jgi:hypothetical protein